MSDREPYYGPPPDSDSDESYEGFYFGDDVSLIYKFVNKGLLTCYFCFKFFSTLTKKPIGGLNWL